MTAPEDDLEKALRQALSAAVDRVEPGADALDRIRARTGRRPPQPWLLSMASGVFERARYWVWRGHWAWPASLQWPASVQWPGSLQRPASLQWPASLRWPASLQWPGTLRWPASLQWPASIRWHNTLRWPIALAWLSSLPWPRLRRLSQSPGGAPATGPEATGEPARRPWQLTDAGWLRPVVVLVGVAFIAGIAFAVTPFRQAIVQVSSTVLTGGQASGGGSTEGSGSPVGSGTGTSPGGSGSAGTATGTPSTSGSPGPAASSNCQQQASPGPTVNGPAQGS